MNKEFPGGDKHSPTKNFSNFLEEILKMFASPAQKTFSFYRVLELQSMYSSSPEQPLLPLGAVRVQDYRMLCLLGTSILHNHLSVGSTKLS